MFLTILFSLVVLIIIGELFSRVKIYIASGNSSYLFTPFTKNFQPKQVNYEFKIEDFNSDKADNYYYKMKAGTFLPPKPYDYGYFNINSLCFRGKEFSPHKKDGKIRIFCIGESSTFCAESPDSQTWPARLDYYLNQSTKGYFEVINSGFPGAASTTYKNLIRFELIKYRPDIFIIYAGANDMILDRNISAKKSQFSIGIHSTLYYKSMLYTLLLEKISSLAKGSPVPMNAYDSKPEEVFSKNTEEIIKLCKKHNIRLIFIRQLYNSYPDLFLRDDLSLKEIKHILGTVQDKKWITLDKVYTFSRLMKNLTGLCVKCNIPEIDFRRDFYNSLVNDEQLFFDYIHLTPKGNDLLASFISEYILNELKN